jgi:hypothetical protein
MQLFTASMDCSRCPRSPSKEQSLTQSLITTVGTVLGITSGHAMEDFGFSLETACWLFDFAWAAYYDPPGVTTHSGFGPIQIPHGFTVRCDS